MCRCATSWSDLDFNLDMAVVTLTYKILSGLFNACREIHTAAVVLFFYSSLFKYVVDLLLGQSKHGKIANV